MWRSTTQKTWKSLKWWNQVLMKLDEQIRNLNVWIPANVTLEPFQRSYEHLIATLKYARPSILEDGRFWNVSSFSQICNLLHFQKCTVYCMFSLTWLRFCFPECVAGSSSCFNVSFWRILRLCRRWQITFFLDFVIVQRMSNAENHKMFSWRFLKITILWIHLSLFGDLVEKSIFRAKSRIIVILTFSKNC